MAKQRAITEKSMNITPEEVINERLEELGDEWKVLSAVTDLVTHGNIESTYGCGGDHGNFSNIANHVYYVTTVIVERK